MLQKTTWMRYLTLGTSIIFLISFTQCKKQIDYLVKGTYVYINSTNTLIEVKGTNSFIINPNQSYTLVVEGEGPKEVTSKNYTPPFGEAIIIYNNTQCDTLEASGEGIRGINNYVNEKLSERNYKFTYTFTDSDYQKAMPCN